LQGVIVEPTGHGLDGMTFGLLRRFSILLVDRGYLERLRGAAQPVTAQRCDVGSEVVPADHHHPLDAHLKTVDAVFVKRHMRLRASVAPESNLTASRVRPATLV